MPTLPVHFREKLDFTYIFTRKSCILRNTVRKKVMFPELHTQDFGVFQSTYVRILRTYVRKKHWWEDASTPRERVSGTSPTRSPRHSTRCTHLRWEECNWGEEWIWELAWEWQRGSSRTGGSSEPATSLLHTCLIYFRVWVFNFVSFF